MSAKPLSREEAIEVARTAAHECGYALAVHGSMERDVDLVAVPWVEAAEGPAYVAETISSALPGGGHINGPAEIKPHGRMAWSIIPLGRDPHDEHPWYIDLSVCMPMGDAFDAIQAAEAREAALRAALVKADHLLDGRPTTGPAKDDGALREVAWTRVERAHDVTQAALAALADNPSPEGEA